MTAYEDAYNKVINDVSEAVATAIARASVRGLLTGVSVSDTRMSVLAGVVAGLRDVTGEQDVAKMLARAQAAMVEIKPGASKEEVAEATAEVRDKIADVLSKLEKEVELCDCPACTARRAERRKH
jgi:hypothetical protein